MPMHVTLFSNLDALRAFSDDWDRLAAGNPFRSWAWNAAWWEAYGDPDQNGKSRIWTLGVFDEQNQLRGIAPWYRYRSKAKGEVISFLGSGKVCSDYLGIMAAPGDESIVVNQITDWLLDPSQRSPLERWDLLHFDGIDDEDPIMNLFAERLHNESSLSFHRKPGLSCWRLKLEPTLEKFLKAKGKNFKRLFRRSHRVMEEPTDLRLGYPKNLDELDQSIEIFIDLHQRRRHLLGQPGCFASSRFEQFYRSVLPELFRRGQANIFILYKGDIPIGVDYNLFGGGIAYGYQSGMDPDYAELNPGHIMHSELIIHFIEQGILALDFLRGNEEYKRRWKANKRITSIWHVAAPHWAARCRNFLRRTGEEVKATAKRGLQQVGLR